ncbi:MAG: hypothetical protein Q8S73_08160 [Deltaproteobacteria bacterium]|nr:hypothetical protein [Deltaproteobacteria bacterium]
MPPDTTYIQSLSTAYATQPMLALVSLGWAVLFAGAAVAALRRVWRRDDDALAFAALVAGAAALRLAVPHGPFAFVEAERLSSLWTPTFGINRPFLSWGALLGVLRALGCSPAALFRYGNPLAGALGVGLLFSLARAAGLSRRAAIAAGCVLLAWPAHVRYSASGDLVIPGSALWTGAFAVALAPGIARRWRLPLLIAACVVGCEMRPEYTICAAALIVMASHTEGLSLPWLALAATGVALVVSGRLVPNVALTQWSWRHLSPAILYEDFIALFDPALTPSWWVLAGAVGLALGALPPRVRLASGAAVLLLAIAYGTLGNEENPLWGQSRYTLTFVPLLALGAAALVERAPAPARPHALAAMALAALLSGPLYAALLLRPVNTQLEYAYLTETAPRFMAGTRDVLMLDEPPVGGHAGQWIPQGLPAMALGVTVSSADIQHHCPAVTNARNVHVWTIALADCPFFADARGQGRLVLYAGVFRPEASWRALVERLRLEPLDERTLRGASLLPTMYDRQCASGRWYVGAAAPDCAARVGWYRVAP